MKIYRTAGITATWRYMAKVDDLSIEQVSFPIRMMGYVLGWLDTNSVKTIEQRTKYIDSVILKTRPTNAVEIGSGFSSRSRRFKNIKFFELDLDHIKKRKQDTIPFDISKDRLDINVKDALFIVEGVTMYLQEKQVISLLNQIKKYKGYLLIDFFNSSYSARHKTFRENVYKFLFKLLIGRNHLFDYRIESIEHGKKLLRDLGYKNIKHFPYSVEKTLDCLFYCRL
ncbi:MAG: hypothetical protein QGH34_00225 [Candidatus Woesearchaeota archaeon]|nr:hypothetical protein [Candidatus Woesearchaeota archaeon]